MAMNSIQRFAIRTSIITGATMATILGAQSLMLLDEARFAVDDSVQSDTLIAEPMNSVSGQPVTPNIAVLRHPGQNTVQVPQSNTPIISITTQSGQVLQTAPQAQTSVVQQAVAPSPVRIVPPSPVTVAQPVIVRSASTKSS